jgi:threonine synthase
LCFHRKYGRLAAAYAARSGRRAVVIIPQGKVAAGKLAGAVRYGAEVGANRWLVDDALNLVVKSASAIRLRWSIRSIHIAWKAKKTAALKLWMI